jgi:hypothetical protein
MTLLEDFMNPQPSKLWSDCTLSLRGSSSAMASFIGPNLNPSESVSIRHLRLPWGETLEIKGEAMTQDDEFSFLVTPANSPLDSPLALFLTVTLGLLLGFLFALKFAKMRQKKLLYVELILVPLVLVIHVLGFLSVFVGGAVGTVILIWWVTAITSPRSRTDLVEEALLLTTPVIPCPACGTPNPVVSQERPLRFACVGCQRVIKIVA